jgi:hypothetical protein
VISSIVDVAGPAVLALAVMRIGLLIAAPGGATKLPNPKKIGLPAGGLATPAAVHAALGGRPAKRRWWT